MKPILFYLMFVLVLLASCSSDNGKADAYGNFESETTLISAEVSGKIVKMFVETGQQVKKGDTLAVIDTAILVLQRRQLVAQKSAVKVKFNNIINQVAVADEQLTSLLHEQQRIEKLLRDKVATQKQYDDISAQVNISRKQIESIKSQNAGVFAEIDVIDTQIAIINEQIKRAVLISPITGVVLEKYMQAYEMAIQGKPVCELADMGVLTLRAYVSAVQLTEITLGQQVEVFYDKTADEKASCSGSIAWISDEAEFTPKIIQTHEERVNLVYAVKITVPNKGALKIGMPGEVNFKNK